MSNNKSKECNGRILCSIWQALKKPSVSYSLGTLLIVGFISGIIFWGGFNTAMEMTNNEEFCISCHEMEANVFAEYKETIHYTNRTGVRATCGRARRAPPGARCHAAVGSFGTGWSKKIGADLESEEQSLKAIKSQKNVDLDTDAIFDLFIKSAKLRRTIAFKNPLLDFDEI